jgi:hypothetical protein
VILGFLILARPVPAQEASVEDRLREWYSRFDGAETADGHSDNGTRLNAPSDLGLDEYEFAHEIQLNVDIKRMGRFSTGYWRLGLEGEDVVAVDANFPGWHGYRFEAGVRRENTFAGTAPQRVSRRTSGALTRSRASRSP